MLKDIHEMTNKEKLGQLLMPTYGRTTMHGEAMTLIDQFKVGGVLLTNLDMQQGKKLAKLNRNLQYYATNQKPLFIMNRQTVEDLQHPQDLSFMPKEKIMYELHNRLYTEQLAEVIGQEMHEIGINTYAYPNLHMPIHEHIRQEVDQVAHHGIAAMNGFEKSGVISFVKGFPAEAEIDASTEVNRKNSNLYPFYEIVQKGAHVLVVTEASSFIIQQYIRERLHFTGLIAYEVAAENSSAEQISHQIVQAINNGVQLLILPFAYEQQVAILNHLFEAMTQGAIHEDAIHHAAAAILSLKEKFQLQTLTHPGRPLTEHFIKSVKEKVIHRIASSLSTR